MNLIIIISSISVVVICIIVGILLFSSNANDTFIIKSCNITRIFTNKLPTTTPAPTQIETMTNSLNNKDINAVIMLHWGWTDLLQHVGMVRYYKTLYKSVSLICLSYQRDFIEALYPDFNLLFVPCPNQGEIEVLSRKLFEEDYLFLVEGHQCSQSFTRICLSQNFIPQTEIQHRNCDSLKKTALNFIDSIKESDGKDPDFDERVGFYTLSGLDHYIAFEYFDIVRDMEAEEVKYQELVTTQDYSVIHYVDGMDLSKAQYPLVYLNDKSTIIIDMIKVIQKAKEVHLYDSLYGILCYFLYFSGRLKGPKFHLHKYARMKIPKFFNYTKMKESKEWIVYD
jgi:hypothetical protein